MYLVPWRTPPPTPRQCTGDNVKWFSLIVLKRLLFWRYFTKIKTITGKRGRNCVTFVMFWTLSCCHVTLLHQIQSSHVPTRHLSLPDPVEPSGCDSSQTHRQTHQEMHFHFLRNHKKQNKSCSSPSETHRLALDVRRRQDGRSIVWRIYSICIRNCVQFTNSLFHNLVRLTAAGGHIAVVLQGRVEHGGAPDGPPSSHHPPRTWREEKKQKRMTPICQTVKKTKNVTVGEGEKLGSWFLVPGSL